MRVQYADLLRLYRDLSGLAESEYKLTGAVVNITPVADPNANFYTKLQTMFAAGTPPNLSSFQGWEWQTYSDKNLLVPLDDYIKKSNLMGIYPDGVSSVEVSTQRKGKRYLAPLQMATMVMFYAKKPFQDAGIPFPKDDWTFDQFVETAQKLTDAMIFPVCAPRLIEGRTGLRPALLDHHSVARRTNSLLNGLRVGLVISKDYSQRSGGQVNLGRLNVCEPVHGHTRDGIRQSGDERRHARQKVAVTGHQPADAGAGKAKGLGRREEGQEEPREHETGRRREDDQEESRSQKGREDRGRAERTGLLPNVRLVDLDLQGIGQDLPPKRTAAAAASVAPSTTA